MPGLDGMRALAVVAVMVYHADVNWLHGGFLGVEVFFVISGYLITLLLLGERERTGRIDLRQFWIRRFRRLLPALLVMMGLLAVYLTAFYPKARGRTRGDFIAGFPFYSSNWYQIWVGQGYGATEDFAPLRHLWSLAVEEQFYLVWPVLLLALWRSCGTDGAQARRLAVGGAAALAALSFAGALVVGESRLTLAFFASPLRAWELLAGAALALHQRGGPALPARQGSWLAALGLAAVLASAAGLSHDSHHPGWPTLLPVAGALALIANAFVWKEVPLATILLLVTMKSIPSDLYSAAKVDGANVW
ncbi:MAG TPA: acyltransferase family protein, partial [Ilumatobacteraceae bacterium]|nr:acyltransferase family protein [Ilumatobacteraceae bacterium]